ncbi:MAG TPA: YetF domain-containing protein [Gaiellales bacterium]|nr:YetF domain-containing protein [Gaiellales bacterium]
MDIVLRGIVLFIFVSFIMRIVGRRELSSMGAIDLVLLIVLGDSIQQGLTQDDYSVTGAMIAVSTIALMQVSLSFLSYRVRRLRPVLEGEPIVIVQDGRVIEKNLRRDRITVDEVLEEARQQQIGSLDDVAWAVLEANGQISFLPK